MQGIIAYVDPQSGLPPLPGDLGPLRSAGLIALALSAALLLALVASLWWWRWRPRRPRPRDRQKEQPRRVGRGSDSPRWRLGVLVLVVMLLAGLVAWRYWGTRETAGGPRVLVLAMDGLDPVRLSRLMAEGRLPNFTRLAKEGTYHPLATVLPPQSPVAWATFITGLSPAEHGVFDFVRRDPRTYALDLTTADRHGLSLTWRGTPFWENEPIRSLGFRGLRMPMTFPPPPVRKGRLLAGMGVFDIRGTEGTYLLFASGAPQLRAPRGLLLPLEPQEQAWTGQIPGPLLADGEHTLYEALVLTPEADGAGATLRVSGNEYHLWAGRWSEWIHVRFRLPDGREALTLTKAIFEQRNQDTFLYLSPLEFDPADPVWPISYPSGYAAELAAAIGPYHTRGIPFDLAATRDGVITLPMFLEQCRHATEESERMLQANLADFDSGVLFVYFEAADMVQHMAWGANDEASAGNSPGTSSAYRDPVAETYESLDAVLGRAWAAVGPDTTVVVLSDHGGAPVQVIVNLNAMLRSMGYLTLLPGRDGSGLAYTDVDWSRTRAYAVGYNGIFLNLRGREGQGTVPAHAAPALAAEIASRFEGVIDHATGQRPMFKVYPGVSAYGGRTHPNCPDLLVGYARGYSASQDSAQGAANGPPLRTNRNTMIGDHMIDPSLVPGVFLSSDARLDADGLGQVGEAINRYLEARLHGAPPPTAP